jgi:hypothetical protein
MAFRQRNLLTPRLRLEFGEVQPRRETKGSLVGKAQPFRTVLRQSRDCSRASMFFIELIGQIALQNHPGRS